MHSELQTVKIGLAIVLIGLGSLYPFAWLSMFYLAPSIGRSAAHDHLLTEMFTLLGVAGLLLGSLLLVANLFFGAFADKS